MGDRTGIEWTDATWNPTVGCDRVSPGCDNCYAIGVAHRFSGQPDGAYTDTTARVPVSDGTERSDWTGQVNLIESRLDQPLRWSRPRRIFVNSMSDLFHEGVPDEFIARAFAVMGWANWHIFQILTKRHGRMRSLLNSEDFWNLVAREIANIDGGQVSTVSGNRAVTAVDERQFPNVWLGVSVEDQKRADLRIPALLQTPAAVRFLSCEPLVGPLDLGRYINDWDEDADGKPLPWFHGVDWVIVGGESGPNARPMNPRWARSLRDECWAVNVPFLFKQWGNWAPAPYKVLVPESRPRPEGLPTAATSEEAERIGATHVIKLDGYVHQMQHKPWSVERNDVCPPEWEPIRHYGQKAAAGRHLDGVLHDGYPA